MIDCKSQVCGLNKDRFLNTSYQMPINPTGKRIMFISDTPDLCESVKQQVFISEKGVLVRETLKELGYKPEEMYFTYACKCCNNIDRAPVATEIKECSGRLRLEIKEWKPDVIISMGLHTLRAFKEKAISIEDARGLPFEYRYGVGANDVTWVYPTYSPGYIFRVPNNFITFKDDLQKAIETEYPVVIKPIKVTKVNNTWTYQEIIDLCNKLKQYDELTFDIETTGFSSFTDIIRVIGLSPNDDESYQFETFPLYDKTLNAPILDLLTCPTVKFIGHNAIAFDAPFMRRQLKIDMKIHKDTMLRHYCIDERKGTHSLGKLGREFCFQPEYKSMIKDYADAPMPLLSEYLGIDTALTYKLDKALDKNIDDRINHVYFDFIHPVAEALSDMQFNGAPIDVPYLEKLGKHLDHQIARLLRIIRQKTYNPVFNPNSPAQVARYLYDTLKLKPIKARSTAEEVITQYAGEHKHVRLIVDYRALVKLKSTYVEGILKRLDPDGKIRSHYLIHGAETDRISSQDPNLQNIPARIKAIKKAFIAPKGKLIMEADYSQLELREAARLSGETRLLEAFRSGVDIHRSTASFMFKKKPEDITDDERFAAKSINFGVLYGMGADKLMKTLKCSYKEAEKYLKDWHLSYPELSKWIGKVHAFVLEHSYVETEHGTRRHFPLIVPANEQEVLRQSVNTIVQSTAGYHCLKSLVRINELSKLGVCGIEPILTVHDSIVILYDEDKTEEVIKLMKANMEYEYDDIKLEIDVKYGKTWGDIHKYEKAA